MCVSKPRKHALRPEAVRIKKKKKQKINPWLLESWRTRAIICLPIFFLFIIKHLMNFNYQSRSLFSSFFFIFRSPYSHTHTGNKAQLGCGPHLHRYHAHGAKVSPAAAIIVAASAFRGGGAAIASLHGIGEIPKEFGHS